VARADDGRESSWRTGCLLSKVSLRNMSRCSGLEIRKIRGHMFSSRRSASTRLGDTVREHKATRLGPEMSCVRAFESCFLNTVQIYRNILRPRVWILSFEYSFAGLLVVELCLIARRRLRLSVSPSSPEGFGFATDNQASSPEEFVARETLGVSVPLASHAAGRWSSQGRCKRSRGSSSCDSLHHSPCAVPGLGFSLYVSG
jgi:hypothetical protein